MSQPGRLGTGRAWCCYSTGTGSGHYWAPHTKRVAFHGALSQLTGPCLIGDLKAGKLLIKKLFEAYFTLRDKMGA